MPYREIHPGQIYHVYNRGTCAMEIFRSKCDYERFVSKLFMYSDAFGVELQMHCLMPNHFHLLLKEPEERTEEDMSNMSRMMQRLLNSYSKYFGLKYNHSGNVFQGKFKAKIVERDEYYEQLKKYILENPVRKNLVIDSRAWPYSFVNIGHQ